MRVAVADLGTNACKLLIAEGNGLAFRVTEEVRRQTRLGECLDAEGNLTSEGEGRLIAALRTFAELAQAAGVGNVRAYATSALREAPNAQAVVARVREASGIKPVIISGEREGKLTYLGAAHSSGFGPDNLLLDLGGGSLELARGGPEQAGVVVSLPLGAVRLHREVLFEEPPGAQAVAALERRVTETLASHLDPFRVNQNTRVFGSSGTFQALGAAIASRQGAARVSEHKAGGFTFEVGALGELLRELQDLTPAQRIQAGIEPLRTDIIVAGAAVLHAALRTVGAERVTVSGGALREGMLLEAFAAGP
ncbi:hypothetical protein DKM44_11085 [Deinococcus irradiatisoli]|uniref:Ppx/GppA phosphatase N-terminal domain-containing protein n=1 Tax=Deinococcus irradiatisoli TaxID=2202254 RepID=A0A2Z3JI74_9DEIO|nr:hypothetical protein [Deinococcus irradiatisoli]AWN23706.1 hypothetical protein DKM44_11085 [Deinococcus irradiatisoli]